MKCGWIGERRDRAKFLDDVDDDLEDLRLWAGRIWIISVDQVIEKLDFLGFYENLLNSEFFQSQKLKIVHTSNEMSKCSIDVT